MSSINHARLESLDILRGFDLFCLVGLEAVVHAMGRAADASWFGGVMHVFTHAAWEGFTPWDMVMPLFMFMAGVTIPFSRKCGASERPKMVVRILKRVVILWLFGLMCQGNLLAFDPDRIYVYSNTLQAIAVGYLVAALMFMFTSLPVQVLTAFALMGVYWTGMEFISVDGYGGGSYEAQSNFAEWVDRICMGRYRDGAAAGPGGGVVYASWYTYTWIWSSLTFAVTVMMGVFAGVILRDGKSSPLQRTVLLVIIGCSLIMAELLISPIHPIIKRIWSVSMTLLSGGICYLLMALFYYVIDCPGCRSHLGWLKVYGMNSITAYMLMSCVNFSCIAESLLYGVRQWLGPWYEVLVAASCLVLIYLVLKLLYDRKIFLRV